MLALGLYRRGLCQQCIGSLDETTDPHNEDRYVPIEPVQCYRCVGLARSEEAYRDQPHPHTLIHRVELRR